MTADRKNKKRCCPKGQSSLCCHCGRAWVHCALGKSLMVDRPGSQAGSVFSGSSLPSQRCCETNRGETLMAIVALGEELALSQPLVVKRHPGVCAHCCYLETQ